MAHEQRALQRERHVLHHAAGAHLDRLGVGELRAQPRGERVQARVGAGRLVDLVEERLQEPSPPAPRPSARSTSSAMTLPEPSQIEFSGISRYSRGMPDSST